MGTTMGSGAEAGRTIATQPAMKINAIGIMLLGSVPTPPRNPQSSTSTQSARHNTVAASTATGVHGRRATRKAAPINASATTVNRLTAQP